MKVDLDRRDIIAMLLGTSPSYEVMGKIPERLGSYHGGMADTWRWNFTEVSNLPWSDEELYDFYLICKRSNDESYRRMKEILAGSGKKKKDPVCMDFSNMLVEEARRNSLSRYE